VDSKILRELAKIVGEKYISTKEDVLFAYGASASMSYDRVVPGAVVKPANTTEVAAVITIANEHKIPVMPRSGGSGLQGEVIPPEDSLVIELLRLKDIELYKDLRSVKVGAGITFGALDKFLNQHDLWVPHYPGSSLTATYAGNVAVNGSGFGSALYGCMAEHVLGLEVVLPDGQIIHTGSEANPNAPGPFQRYAFGPDITGLFIGSLGTLGIITKVSLKTSRRMHNFDYNTYGFETSQQAQYFLLKLKENRIGLLWAAIYEGEILDFFLDMIGEEFGVPKTDWSPVNVSLVLGSMNEEKLQLDVKSTVSACHENGGHVIGVRELPKGEWENRMIILARSSYVHGWHWRILYHHQPISSWEKSRERIWAMMDKHGILGHTAGFQSGHVSYNYYPQLYFDPQDSEDLEKTKAAHKELVKELFKTGAVPFKLAPYWVDGIEAMEPYIALLRSIKSTIDPNNIMNPGLLEGF
jgi:FAD/FMN-containing dehydrogenase